MAVRKITLAWKCELCGVELKLRSSAEPEKRLRESIRLHRAKEHPHL